MIRALPDGERHTGIPRSAAPAESKPLATLDIAVKNELPLSPPVLRMRRAIAFMPRPFAGVDAFDYVASGRADVDRLSTLNLAAAMPIS